jgi:DNA-binding PadR family transcriptional regulator
LQDPKLTPTSFIVLGLVELAGEATPYELKQGVAGSVGHFWSIPHAQLYSEPERLTGSGHLTERREEGGRRRRHYTITDQGRAALAAWREAPPDRSYELRDLGLLKLFFGAEPRAVAEAQLEKHREKLAIYERWQGSGGPGLALAAGILHERASVAFWEAIRDGRDPLQTAPGARLRAAELAALRHP